MTDPTQSPEDRRLSRLLTIGYLYLTAATVAVSVAYQAWGIWWPVVLHLAVFAIIMAIVACQAARMRGLGFWETVFHPSRGTDR